VSALAHVLETQGIATTLVALVRMHAEKVRPPRALWVPFELGQPVGPPNQAAFQRRVILAALALLERDDGPVILEDFPDDSPDTGGDPGWRCPVPAHPDDLEAELAGALALHQRFVERSGRTTVGVSGLEPRTAAAYLGALARGETPESPRRDLHPSQLMRFAADDLKALYLEAACADEGHPNGAQLRSWLWQSTALARTLQTLRARCLESEDENFRTIGNGALVPVRWR
jgi:hypothetical protein